MCIRDSTTPETRTSSSPSLLLAFRVARCPVMNRTVRYLGNLSGQKFQTLPDMAVSGNKDPPVIVGCQNRRRAWHNRGLVHFLTPIMCFPKYCGSLYLNVCKVCKYGGPWKGSVSYTHLTLPTSDLV